MVRPTPNDFDPFVVDGQARKVCIDCYQEFDLDDFKDSSGCIRQMCIFCAADGAPIPEPEDPESVGTRIDRGFSMMDDDESKDPFNGC